ncbi:MAG: hypothetical protein JWR18_301 [Segetibacter sp.]|nr:hypothetical protein [Segetibacter sp.]
MFTARSPAPILHIGALRNTLAPGGLVQQYAVVEPTAQRPHNKTQAGQKDHKAKRRTLSKTKKPRALLQTNGFILFYLLYPCYSCRS